jgi:hypothetical protein
MSTTVQGQRCHLPFAPELNSKNMIGSFFMQDGYDSSCGITIETALIHNNRVEDTILAKLLQNTELALPLPLVKTEFLFNDSNMGHLSTKLCHITQTKSSTCCVKYLENAGDIPPPPPRAIFKAMDPCLRSCTWKSDWPYPGNWTQHCPLSAPENRPAKRVHGRLGGNRKCSKL